MADIAAVKKWAYTMEQLFLWNATKDEIIEHLADCPIDICITSFHFIPNEQTHATLQGNEMTVEYMPDISFELTLK